MRYPEAGGSSSFARHAFNELVSFGGRLGADARLRRHGRDLGVLRPALPLDLLGAAADEPVGHRRRRDRDRRPRRAERRRRPGGGEALDHARRHRLRDAGAARRRSASCSSSAPRSWSTTSTGASRRPGRTSRSRCRSRCSPTRASRRSRTSPRRCATPSAASRTPTSSSRSPSSRSTSRCRSIALSALPVEEIDGELTTLLALPPEEGGYANDPILGVVENLGLEGSLLDGARDLRRRARGDDPLHRHERGRDRRLAHHVLDGDATGSSRRSSAGCIRASRRRGSRSSSSPASRRSRSSCPGDVDFVGTLYSFGATLSFTVAHASIDPDADAPPGRRSWSTARGRTSASAGSTGRSSRSSAGSPPAISFARHPPPERGDALGGPRLDRRRPSSATWSTAAASCASRSRRRSRRRRRTGPALALEYRRLLVPVVPGPGVRRRVRRRREPRGRARRADRRA